MAEEHKNDPSHPTAAQVAFEQAESQRDHLNFEDALLRLAREDAHGREDARSPGSFEAVLMSTQPAPILFVALVDEFIQKVKDELTGFLPSCF